MWQRSRIGWILIIWGVLLLAASLVGMGQKTQSTPEPREMTLREFLNGKAGPNQHITVTDFRLCNRYVTHHFKREQRRWISHIGVLPAEPDDEPSGIPRLIVKPRLANEEPYQVKEWRERKSLSGILERPDGETDWDKQQLRDAYPGIDLSSCMILAEGRGPPTPLGWSWVGVGGTVLFLGLIVVSLGRQDATGDGPRPEAIVGGDSSRRWPLYVRVLAVAYFLSYAIGWAAFILLAGTAALLFGLGRPLDGVVIALGLSGFACVILCNAFRWWWPRWARKRWPAADATGKESHGPPEPSP